MHLLSRTWHFYLHFRVSRDHVYGDVASFESCIFVSTVEQFWSVMHKFLSPSDAFHVRYSPELRRLLDDRVPEGLGIFMDGVVPMWEHPINIEGGHWEGVVTDVETRTMDRVWEELAMALVGEILPHSDVIVGFRIIDRSRRQESVFRIEVWLSRHVETQRHDICRHVACVLVDEIPHVEWIWKHHDINHA